MKPPRTVFDTNFARHTEDLAVDLSFDSMTESPAAIMLPRRKVHRRKPTSRRTFDFSAIQNAVDRLDGLPAQGETWHLLQDPSFSTFDLVAGIVRLADQPCRELWLTTLGTNARTVAGFREMMDAGTLRKLTVLLSVYFRDADREQCRVVTEELRAIGAEVHVARVHCKLALLDFGNRQFTAESSANAWSCRCVEQLTLTHDRELCRFYKTALQTLIKSDA